eukprot:CAMPEP_0196223564 /NCGR_PEP_ID=MMETSP0912-20130531/46954_1 /TAXON_ID=49265 /ORGANISM="Thalassiosira rotula, Strain GSO102" /LENGTH=50 /DNA_ID=CAMNT_0041502653 /DNA_START=172 /DNA_END=324 /DNA_ORIENTATION=-
MASRTVAMMDERTSMAIEMPPWMDAWRRWDGRWDSSLVWWKEKEMTLAML